MREKEMMREEDILREEDLKKDIQISYKVLNDKRMKKLTEGQS